MNIDLLVQGFDERDVLSVRRYFPDYPRMDWYRRQHHERFRRYVEQYGLPCQACGASGDVAEDYVAGAAIYRDCGWCEGTGKVTRWTRGLWLRWKHKERQRKRKARVTKGEMVPA